jgi:hypothetical protein
MILRVELEGLISQTLETDCRLYPSLPSSRFPKDLSTKTLDAYFNSLISGKYQVDNNKTDSTAEDTNS